jgi:saccharopine dehydrogenase-like NADP-dependent oxidoreductase
MENLQQNKEHDMAEKTGKNVLILGAGLVTKPGVDYLAEHGFAVTVASRTVSKAEALIRGLNHGRAHEFLIDDKAALNELVAAHDLTVSLLPARFHVEVAEACLANGKPMVTTSYVKPQMRALDEKARQKGLLLLNELGLDPGIDHMSAMKIIDEVAERGGKVAGFKSYCGGLPAPQAKTTPWGYKFSWSPRGVVLAGTNPARFLQDGEVIDIPGPELFGHHWPVEVQGAGVFEAYPNRDSLPYKDLYGLSDATTMLRGTLRYPGWCETWKKMVELGLLSLDKRDDLERFTYRGLMASLAGGEPKNAEQAVCDYLSIALDSEPMRRWKWLGLFAEDKVPAVDTVLDALSQRLRQKLQYGPKEQDMIVLHHVFDVDFGAEKKTLTSTLVAFGAEQGDSAMSRTVSLPAAIGTRLILEGKLTETGVRIPVEKEIYAPVLAELERMGIGLQETER